MMEAGQRDAMMLVLVMEEAHKLRNMSGLSKLEKHGHGFLLVSRKECSLPIS